MTWSQAINEIPARAAEQFGETVTPAMRLAVRLALECECDNWLHQNRK